MKPSYLIAITLFLSMSGALVLSACTRARPEAPNVVLPTLVLPSPIPTLAPTAANPTTVAGGPEPTLLIIVTPIRQPTTEAATATLTSAPRLSTATHSATETTAPSATLASAGPSTVTIAPNPSATLTSIVPSPTPTLITIPTRAPATHTPTTGATAAPPTAVAQTCPGARACILISPTVANLKQSAVSLAVRGYGFPTGQVTINIGPKSSNCLFVNSCISEGIAHAGIGGNFDATILILPNNPLLADVRQLQVVVIGGRGTVRATADLTNTGGR